MVSAASAVESAAPAQDRPAFGMAHVPAMTAGRGEAPNGAAGKVARDETAVRIRLSPEARAALAPPEEPAASLIRAFTQALAQGLRTLNRDATKVFALLGLSPAQASQAAAALSDAIREATGTPAAQAEVVALVATQNRFVEDGYDYRASIVVDQADLIWDPGERRFVASLRRMALSVDVASGYVVPRGVQRAVEGAGIASLRVDAAVPVRFALSDDERPGRVAAGPTPVR